MPTMNEVREVREVREAEEAATRGEYNFSYLPRAIQSMKLR